MSLPSDGSYVPPSQPVLPGDADDLSVLSLSLAASADRTGPRARLREFRFTRTQAAICTAEVELEAPDGRRVTGRGRGAAIPTGELRAAADATLAALALLAPEGALPLELAGVKSLRAFDETIVIVAITADRAGEPVRLLGCVLAAGDVARGAALATLNATNRVLTFGPSQ